MEETKSGTPPNEDIQYLETLKQTKEQISVPSSNMEDYYKALDEYFTLKDDYEMVYKTKIKAIAKRNISKKNKKKETAKFKKNRRCISCGNLGGTFFGIETSHDGTKEYTASCLAILAGEEDCGLDIRLKKGKVINIDNKEIEISKNIEDIKTRIIIGKLSLLFDLENENVALKEFDDLKSDLEKYSEQLKLIEEKHSENYTVKILNKNSEPEIISKKLYIKALNNQLDKHIYKYKSIIFESESTEDFKRKGYLKDAYRFLIDTIMPLLEKIRNIIYQVNMVETNEKNKTQFEPIIYSIIHKEVANENQELIGDEYAIIENTK